MTELVRTEKNFRQSLHRYGIRGCVVVLISGSLAVRTLHALRPPNRSEPLFGYYIVWKFLKGID